MKLQTAFLDTYLVEVRAYLESEFSTGLIEWERLAVLESMCYQLGIAGFRKFKNMISAIDIGDWGEAAKQALDSRWAKQTPKRAERHAEVLRTGTLEAYKGLL